MHCRSEYVVFARDQCWMHNSMEMIPHALVQRANWSPRLRSDQVDVEYGTESTHLTTREPGMGTALIHFPAAFRTCSALVSSCCHRIVKHCREHQHPSGAQARKRNDLVARECSRLMGQNFLSCHSTYSVCDPMPIVRSSATPV
jgi:hypothetical protein